MRIGIRKSPHLEALALGIQANGDTFTSTYDTGADFYLCWGWPQAEQVAKDNGGQHHKIICVDAHPFALMAGNTSGSRILQLGNWGALAEYPEWESRRYVTPEKNRSTPGGPVLVLGQVYTAIQKQGGLVDVWHTAGYEDWVNTELAKPERKFRKHPRVWAVENDGELQPSLLEDLQGCRRAIAWNSTASIHAQLLGWPAETVEVHGWADLGIERLASLEAMPGELKSGEYWARYRAWLASQTAAADFGSRPSTAARP